jgi:hypothetical protein
MLVGFSQFQPQDGVPAADSAQALVRYSSTAIYFGIRATSRLSTSARRSPTATRSTRTTMCRFCSGRFAMDDRRPSSW